MTTDNDEVHGTVIDPDYVPEAEAESPTGTSDAASEAEPPHGADGEASTPHTSDQAPGSAQEPGYAAGDDDEEYATPVGSTADHDESGVASSDGIADDEPEDEDDDEYDDEDEDIIVESSSVVGEDDERYAADDEAAGDETGEPAAAVGAYQENAALDDRSVPPDEPDAAPEDLSGQAATPGTVAADRATVADDVTPAPAAPAHAHSRSAGDSTFAGDAGLAGDTEEMYKRWAAIQSGFVDDPRGSVGDAAALLSDALTTLVDKARAREQELRGESDREGLDTEDLRNILRRYRSLLERLAAL